MSLDQVMTAVLPIAAAASVREAAQRFADAPGLEALAVVGAAMAPCALLRRDNILAAGVEAADASVLSAADTRIVIVERAEPLAAAGRRLADLAQPGDPLLAVENGRYVGLIPPLALTQALCAETERQAEALGALASTVGAAENQARHAHRLLEAVFESIGEGLAVFDAQDRFVLWNRAYADLRPRSPLLRVGATFKAVIEDDLAHGYISEAVGREDAWMAERMARRTKAISIHEQPLPNGRWIRTEDRRLADGGIISVIVDITELRQREALFRLMFEENPVPLTVFDQQTLRVLAANQASLRQYGYSADEALLKSVPDVLAPEEREAALTRAEQSMYSARDARTGRHVRSDGQVFDVLSYMSPIAYEGQPAVLAATVEITAQKRAEAELERARWFLDTVINAIPEMLIVKEGIEHRIVLANSACQDLMGLSNADLIGKTDFDLVDPELAEAFVAQDKAVLASGQLQIKADEPLNTSKGLRYLQTKKIAMPMPAGERPHLLVISEDVTERKASAEALEAARDQAEAASRAKSQFLANMSHEIRTPLNGVTGVVSVLARTALAPDQREMVQIIQDSAATLEVLLSDVLDLARVESGKMELRRDPFAVEDLVRRCGSLFRPRAEQKGLAFKLDVAADAVGYHLGDPARLQQILNNLLNNAIKFTTDGVIGLRVTRAADGRHRFEVRDTGIGFDEAAAAKIFQRFEQADGSITRQFGGTGLGLSISRDLAEQMGGDLAARSTPGEGSIFTLTVPLSACEAPAEAAADGPDAAAAHWSKAGGAARILVADDHAINRQVVALILDQAPVELTMAENGAQALAAFEAERFDLVLMDLQMPVMDGLTAMRRMRLLETGGRPRTPILALSANAMPEHVAAAHDAGADGHIAKPIVAGALIAAIEAALEPQADADHAARA